MALSYPSKQTLVIAVLCTVVVVGVIIYLHKSAPSQKIQLSIVSQSTNSDQTQLTNNNADWKKDFFAVATSSFIKEAKKTGTTTPLTLTGEISRDFFTRYIALRQNGATTDATAVDGAVNKTINEAFAGALKPKTYQLSDVQTTITTPQSLKIYANTVAILLNTDGPREDAVQIASNALDTQDMSTLSDIDPIITSYKKVIAGLRAISVPDKLADQHLVIINTMSTMGYIAASMRQVDKDPIQSMVAMNIYPDTQDVMKNAFISIKNYLLTQHISFSNNESGILFSLFDENQ